ncbi:MAG TPA: Mpo1-like protein [Rudaea sp.]|nr:Mpo1-like protein [Rudaea sp.]HSC10080.1 Mpo1-like protein [Rhodanobacteraceae bacterium]
MASSERPGGLLDWQWRNYSRNHGDRANLLIHMIGVPVFIAGVLAFVTQAARAQWFGAAVSAVVAVVAFAVQGVGHKRERVAPEPFAGPGDFVARVFAEQFITFPRFVLMGQWARNLAEPDNRK